MNMEMNWYKIKSNTQLPREKLPSIEIDSSLKQSKIKSNRKTMSIKSQFSWKTPPKVQLLRFLENHSQPYQSSKWFSRLLNKRDMLNNQFNRLNNSRISQFITNQFKSFNSSLSDMLCLNNHRDKFTNHKHKMFRHLNQSKDLLLETAILSYQHNNQLGGCQKTMLHMILTASLPHVTNRTEINKDSHQCKSILKESQL